MAAEGEAAALEFTPTWIVAAVCSLIVLLSLVAERCLHYLGKVCMHATAAALLDSLSHSVRYGFILDLLLSSMSLI
jgi:mlo protein